MTGDLCTAFSCLISQRLQQSCHQITLMASKNRKDILTPHILSQIYQRVHRNVCGQNMLRDKIRLKIQVLLVAAITRSIEDLFHNIQDTLEKKISQCDIYSIASDESTNTSYGRTFIFYY